MFAGNLSEGLSVLYGSLLLLVSALFPSLVILCVSGLSVFLLRGLLVSSVPPLLDAFLRRLLVSSVSSALCVFLCRLVLADVAV